MKKKIFIPVEFEITQINIDDVVLASGPVDPIFEDPYDDMEGNSL